VGSISIVHWLIVFAVIANIVFVFRIIWRMGFNPLWGLFMFVPLLNVVVFWFAAFRPWPKGSPR
jgi:hypothetical protein